jgi:hypothetical protein
MVGLGGALKSVLDCVLSSGGAGSGDFVTTGSDSCEDLVVSGTVSELFLEVGTFEGASELGLVGVSKEGFVASEGLRGARDPIVAVCVCLTGDGASLNSWTEDRNGEVVDCERVTAVGTAPLLLAICVEPEEDG